MEEVVEEEVAWRGALRSSETVTALRWDTPQRSAYVVAAVSHRGGRRIV